MAARLRTISDALGLLLQGSLAHKKTPTPLGTPYDPRHRPTVGSQGDAFSYERGTPAKGFNKFSTQVQILDLELYRGTSLIRNTPLLGPYSRTVPRVLR